jgi:hypothetical protein
MLDKLITRVFKARNAAHAEHWTTNSFAEHEALGEFYENVIAAVDKYVEAHQGTFGQMQKAPDQVPNVTQMLRDELMWLTENRSKIAKNVPALENLLDEMAAIYMKTLYKLENLR